MKKALALGLLISVFSSGAALASSDARIGTVDLQRAVTQCKEGAAARSNMIKKSEAMNADLKRMLAEVEKLRGELAKGSDKLSADERTEQNRLLQKKARELQDRQREAQDELKQLESDYLRKLLAKFGTLLTKIGEEENYSTILDRNNGVFYAGKQTDVTPLLVKRADEEYEKR